MTQSYTENDSIHIHFRLFPLAACPVLEDIQWSTQLDRIFLDNYRKDPTLSWQFFGSSTGFMRHFPGQYLIAMCVSNQTKIQLHFL